jgi:hypothetical protein
VNGYSVCAADTAGWERSEEEYKALLMQAQFEAQHHIEAWEKKDADVWKLLRFVTRLRDIVGSALTNLPPDMSQEEMFIRSRIFEDVWGKIEKAEKEMEPIETVLVVTRCANGDIVSELGLPRVTEVEHWRDHRNDAGIEKD